MEGSGFLASGGLSDWHWLLVFALLFVPGAGWLLLPAILVLALAPVASGESGLGLAETLVLLFFLPPATIYGWWRARRIAARQRERGSGLPKAVALALALPAVVALGLAVALAGQALEEGREVEALMALRGLVVSEPLPSTLYTGRALVDVPLAALRFVGNAALILFFLSIPFVLGGAISAILLVLDRFGAPLGLLEERAGPIQPEEVPVSVHSFVLAIDGPAAAGKGTLAKRLAAHYGLGYLDTGLLYRAVGRRAVEEGVDLDDPMAAGEVARSLAPSALDDGSLRGREAGELASRVAVHPPVRAALVAFQRDFAARAEGAVLDGRDIGTVICPDAPVKIFVTASPEVRARRRTEELAAKGRAPDYERILAEVRERDRRDSSRADAPLRAAADAHLLDTSEMTIEEAFRAACDLVDRARATGTEA